MGKIINSTLFRNFVFIYITALVSGASFLDNSDILKIVFFSLIALIAVISRRVYKLPIVIAITIVYVLINVIASLFFNSNIQIYTMMGRLLLLMTAYLVVSIYNVSFLSLYEKFIYKLSIISSIFFILSIVFTNVFVMISPFFQPLTAQVMLLKESQMHYFYSFFFVFIKPDFFRNSGFMWEPGAFALILIIMLMYNLTKNGFHFNKKIYVYICMIISTFSTAGYLALFVLFSYLFYKTNSTIRKYISLVLLILLVYLCFDADFMLPKINEYIEQSNNLQLFNQTYSDRNEANRFLSLILLWQQFLVFPLGWGDVVDDFSFIHKQNIALVNGLGSILVQWGFLFTSFLFYRYYKLFYYLGGKKVLAFICLLSILVVFFSNPISNNIIIYLLLFSSFFCSDEYKNNLRLSNSEGNGSNNKNIFLCKRSSRVWR